VLQLGETALDMATFKDHHAVVRMLLEAGAQHQVSGSSGRMDVEGLGSEL
jgi:ankyrin repeat protein